MTTQNKMQFSTPQDKLLFMKYALPCASTLVRRGVVAQAQVDGWIKEVSQGKAPTEPAELVFKVAYAMCTTLAKAADKKSIDAETIREYFLFKHAEVVDERFKLMKDFNPTDCKTRTGKVIDVGADSALVRTAIGERWYRAVFVGGVEKNRNVVVHFDFIVELITDSVADKMNTAMVGK